MNFRLISRNYDARKKIPTNLGENDSLWWNDQGRYYHVPFGRRRENAEMSIWKQLQVITMALTAVYKQVHIYSGAVQPNV